jgi:hypothetical protein
MFLEPSSFKERKIDMSYFNEWSGEIANSYFNAGVSPTETLMKIAQSEELTPHQVEVLAAEANKEIHKHKYASAKDKYFAADFPLADARKVLDTLQADGGKTKVAVVLPDPQFKSPSEKLDIFKAFGVEPETFDKTASVRAQLKVAAEDGAFLKQKYEDKLIMTKMAVAEAEEKFIKMARQMVIQNDNPKDRMDTLGKIAQFVASSGIHEGLEPLAKVAYILGAEGLIPKNKADVAMKLFKKHADLKAPEALISKWLPAKIINGTHPLYITLKTVRDGRTALRNYDDNYKLVQDQLNFVKQKVRAL